jgi:hypothetical protein
MTAQGFILWRRRHHGAATFREKLRAAVGRDQHKVTALPPDSPRRRPTMPVLHLPPLLDPESRFAQEATDAWVSSFSADSTGIPSTWEPTGDGAGMPDLPDFLKREVTPETEAAVQHLVDEDRKRRGRS